MTTPLQPLSPSPSARVIIGEAARCGRWKRARTVSALNYDVWTRPDGAEVQVDYYADDPSQLTGTYLSDGRDEVRKSDDVDTIVGWFVALPRR